MYLASLNGSVQYWDTGEAQVVPWIFGIMHPTGFPVFTILAGIFAHTFAFGSVAWRITVFSALAMSASAWLVSRTVMQLSDEPWMSTAYAWAYAFGSVTWIRGTRAEVHALAIFFALAALYPSIRWYRTGKARVLIAGALAWGLGIATHPIDALLFPALVVIFASRIRRVSVRAFAMALVALCFGLAWYIYLPARSVSVTAARLDPTRTLGIPPGRPFWDNDHPSTWSGFLKEVSGNEFSAGGAIAGMVWPDTYLHGGSKLALALWSEISPLGILLAAGGFYALARREPFAALALAAAFAFPTAFALAYQIEADAERYYLIGFAVALVLAGYGACSIVKALPSLRSGVTLVSFALALGLLFANRHTFEQPRSSGAQTVITTAIKKTPRNAVLIAPWLFATPLAYGAYVERSLDDRIVETAWLADDAAHVPVWMRTHPVYVVGIVFGSVPHTRLLKISGNPDLYRVVPWPPSSRSRSQSPFRISARRPITISFCSQTRSCTATSGSRGPVHTSMR